MRTARPVLTAKGQFAALLLLAVAADFGLYAYGVARGYGLHASYLMWNLFLAVLPLFFALRLLHVLQYKRWSDWEPLAWTLIWWLFLPNSFYMISDFIHLYDVPSVHILYAAVLYASFIYLGVLAGFGSLGLVHDQLRRRLQPRAALAWIVLTLLSCSFAIYIGRDLRWNSWDVIVNPTGLLFDVSDRLLRPEAYSSMIVTTFSFFVLLASLYGVVWSAARLLRQRAN